MLSRLALRNLQVLPAAVRALQTTPTTTSVNLAVDNEGLPRPQRLDKGSPVRFGFIPDEWFTYFYPKTGVTGPYVFLGSVGTYLVSKEWYVLEHEYYNALSFIVIWIVLVKKFGPGFAALLDKGIAANDKELMQGREDALNELQTSISDIELEKARTQASLMITDIKKENILMQLEAAYRERMANVYNQVKKRLDYQLQIDLAERRMAQRHMSQWIIDSVMKSVTPDLEKQTLQQCISDLQALAKA